jgi:hypothetical protein
MSKEVEDLLKECGCDSEYDLCLDFLRKCHPELCIDCITQDMYYFIGKDEFVKLARECLSKKDKKE